MKVGILNVTGYAGSELARLLYRHPEFRLTSVTGRSAVGKRLSDVFPHLADVDLPVEAELGDVDLVFSALPHRASAEVLAPYLRGGLKVVDISADFRLKDVITYEQWYEVAHPCPEYLAEAVYGLTELRRAEVDTARLVANPGCYPTAALLALVPAWRAGIITEDIIIDAKSGISGAGRSLGLLYHFSEANENVSAYSVDGHRHLPEITQELSQFEGRPQPRVTFLPHLIPMTRGILCSCYAPLVPGAVPLDERGKAQVRELYYEAYRNEPFVRVVAEPPQTKHTLGNNLCLIYPTLDLRTGRLLVISCLDNLVKGAAGQAIQNANRMCGLPEPLGLEAVALYP
jgi:N-acetyl-gamma-glutamyl-phosphate reductase